MPRPDRLLSWAGRTLPFVQPYFQPLSSSLEAGTQAIEDLLRLLRKVQPFVYASILFRPLDDGWLCVSPRRADGSRRTQRLSWEEAENLEVLLQQVLAERLESESRLNSLEEVESPRPTGFWAQLFAAFLEFVDHHRPKSDKRGWPPQVPRLRPATPARRGARGRQTHGWKTVSRHFLRQQLSLPSLP